METKCVPAWQGRPVAPRIGRSCLSSDWAVWWPRAAGLRPRPPARARPRPPQPVTPTQAVTPTEAATTSSVAAPTTTQAGPEIEIIRDVPYLAQQREGWDPPLLDVYAPQQTGPWPLVVMLHGAARTRDIPTTPTWATKVAQRGAVVFVPDWGRRHLEQVGIVRARDAHPEKSCGRRSP